MVIKCLVVNERFYQVYVEEFAKSHVRKKNIRFPTSLSIPGNTYRQQAWNTCFPPQSGKDRLSGVPMNFADI